MNKSELIMIRDFTSKDINLIYSSWLIGLYYGESWFSLIPKNVFMENYHTVIEAILKNPDTIVKIACLKEDENVVLGYAVFNSKALHWVFVKKPWRKIHIAKQLVPKDLKVVTHLTKIGLGIIRNRPIDFNPFLT